ncbi:hypothetical protein [Pseudoalteromonas neustonica]|uniref:hypothetical protein n=1 Tax=Pseudoalteromonas neustonica TaxID=1840331 RepID=UPI0007DAEA04|nr:hypothetical protein [Pseudoalteromonas neustonica]
MSDNKNWKHLILAGLIGAVFTGVSQYFLLQATHSSDLEKTRINAKRELLTTELEERKAAYAEIRKSFVEFYRNQNEKDKQALLVSLRGGMPYFSPRHQTQIAISSAAESSEVWVEQTNTDRMSESLEQLESAFQDDIQRIKVLIDEL